MSAHDYQRNFLEEALLILRGDSMRLPELQHLIAINESRVYWRTRVLDSIKERATTPEQRRAS